MNAWKRVYIDVSPETHAAAQSAARSAGMTMKAYLEKLVTDAAGNAAKAPQTKGKK